MPKKLSGKRIIELDNAGMSGRDSLLQHKCHINALVQALYLLILIR